MDNTRILQLFEARRVEHDITITDLCESIKMDRKSYYYLIEHPDSLKLSTARAIAKHLGFSNSEQKKLFV